MKPLIRQVLAFGICGISTMMASDLAVHDTTFKNKKMSPWFTGPLLAPSAYTVDPGHYSIEPYFSYTRFGDYYTQDGKRQQLDPLYTSNIFIQTKFGLTKRTDLFFGPQWIYNQTQGQRSNGIGDMPLACQVQLYRPDEQSQIPAFRLSFKTSIPLGKYQHLDSKKLGTDARGSGSWLPAVTFSTGKIVQLSLIHYLEYRFSLGYQIGTPVHVRGFNTYGGAANTAGKAYPGNRLAADAALQYNFNQRWAVACDLFYTYKKNNRFKGNPGTLATGAAATMTTKTSMNLSIAPALEYSWSENLGVIGGVWWSLYGQNSRSFISGVFAVCIYI